ncbi:MAG: hypothetical protein M0042_07555 [Nitrospiraceae bacterium]|nr:hypothetical protein [Nitrospiraceae bacterium]
MKRNILAACFILMALIAAGCGSSSSSSTSSTPVYTVAYVPGTGMNAPVQGKTTFQLMITKQSDGSAATGLTPTVSLLMHMENGMNHATPIDSVKESMATPGAYDCSVYYLMASGPGMGTWEMKVTVAGETTTFNPDVAMAMGTETVKATLYGPDDIVSGMSGTSYNKYYLFRDGMISAAMPSLKLFISHSESSLMEFKSASAGSVMSSPTGTITQMSVEASSDGGTTWISGTDNANGHWSVPGLTGLVSGQSTTILVKMSVNSQDKTTDGKTPSGTNEYASFSVTPQ